MKLLNILQDALRQGASDVFIVSGTAIGYRISGKIVRVNSEILTPEDTKYLISQIFEFAGYEFGAFDDNMEYDFSFSIQGIGRFRTNVYKQRGSFAAVLRNVMYEIPDYRALHISESIMKLADIKKGLVLITGSAGSGKSTTLTCMIDRINERRQGHIITIEDPIEFLHRHKNCIISQREINIDTANYIQSLRAALRQSPDVILLGEMRDYDTMQIEMTAAETGQFILSTLHTIGAANTIDRIIDVFPSSQHHQIRVQLSMVLQAVVSQQLIPTKNGGLIPAFEIMKVNNAIRTMIREQKTHQIDTIIQSSEDMQTMDADILRLYKEGIIDRENAVNFSTNSEVMRKRLG